MALGSGVVAARAGAKLAVALRPFVDRIGDRYQLGRRERQLLVLTAAGLETKAAAAAMGCGSKTADEYWRRIYRKTGRSSRAAIVAQVIAAVLGAKARSARAPVRNFLTRREAGTPRNVTEREGQEGHHEASHP